MLGAFRAVRASHSKRITSKTFLCRTRTRHMTLSGYRSATPPPLHLSASLISRSVINKATNAKTKENLITTPGSGQTSCAVSLLQNHLSAGEVADAYCRNKSEDGNNDTRTSRVPSRTPTHKGSTNHDVAHCCAILHVTLSI